MFNLVSQHEKFKMAAPPPNLNLPQLLWLKGKGSPLRHLHVRASKQHDSSHPLPCSDGSWHREEGGNWVLEFIAVGFQIRSCLLPYLAHIVKYTLFRLLRLN